MHEIQGTGLQPVLLLSYADASGARARASSLLMWLAAIACVMLTRQTLVGGSEGEGNAKWTVLPCCLIIACMGQLHFSLTTSWNRSPKL